jgi:hypothetical protein
LNGDVNFIVESPSIQVTKTVIQGWLRKKNMTGNTSGVELYPVRYFQLRRDTGELKILRENDIAVS